MAVRPVHPLERFLAAPALIAPFTHLGDEDRGVVVAALSVLVELAGPVQQRGNAGDAVGAIERNLQRPNGVPGELITERQVNNALVVRHRIQPLDLVKNVESGHRRRAQGL
jgi:hypothetical protein